MRNLAYRILQFVYWISLGLTAAWGGLSKVDATRLKGHADAFIPILLLFEKYSWLSVVSGSLVAICTFGMRTIGPPWVRHAIKNVLDEMHSYAFGRSNRAEFHDRVTLFKHEWFCVRRNRTKGPIVGGFLIPFARSGFMTQKSSVVFRVPDDATYEGVAGFAFTSNVRIARENLPDVSPSASPSDQEFIEYAGATFVDVEWLKKERSTARCLYGIPVRVGGKPWGAIVVDSREKSITNSEHVVKSYYLVASVLGQLIRRS